MNLVTIGSALASLICALGLIDIISQARDASKHQKGTSDATNNTH